MVIDIFFIGMESNFVNKFPVKSAISSVMLKHWRRLKCDCDVGRDHSSPGSDRAPGVLGLGPGLPGIPKRWFLGQVHPPSVVSPSPSFALWIADCFQLFSCLSFVWTEIFVFRFILFITLFYYLNINSEHSITLQSWLKF